MIWTVKLSTTYGPHFLAEKHVDLEHSPDVPNEDRNNSTDGNPQHGSDGTIGGIEPYVGQEFESEAAALEFYCSYATRTGFVTRMRDHNCSQRDGSIISRTLVCNREGFRKSADKPRMPWSRKPRAVTRVGCRARVSFRKQSNGAWVIRSLVKEHTHPLALPENQSPKARGNPKIYQVPADDKRVHELMRELMVEKKRNASLTEFIQLLFNHIEEHTQGLSEKIQCIVEKVNKMESEGKKSGSEIVMSL
ncbi:hypothetical protein H0E87_016200 [Populus deltoides]|uniref:FAR1 domain-containing protein n=1 Tax=Populus deltoides TaxID=3696 RepID=A0A8T2Y8A0_POPDE|nr:hypothetical protein H0E87_016200 [Populus deltoides]